MVSIQYRSMPPNTCCLEKHLADGQAFNYSQAGVFDTEQEAGVLRHLCSAAQVEFVA
jgi:hypothetical protein